MCHHKGIKGQRAGSESHRGGEERKRAENEGAITVGRREDHASALGYSHHWICAPINILMHRSTWYYMSKKCVEGHLIDQCGSWVNLHVLLGVDCAPLESFELTLFIQKDFSIDPQRTDDYKTRPSNTI